MVQLGKGTLARDSFEHYIKQDYHYLRHCRFPLSLFSVARAWYRLTWIDADARAHSLGAYKCTAFEDMQAFTQIALHIAQESEMHVSVSLL